MDIEGGEGKAIEDGIELIRYSNFKFNKNIFYEIN